MDYPNQLIRGLQDKDKLMGQDGASASAFYFNEILNKKISQREDGCFEESINWYDNDDALALLLNQKKDGKCQFKSGAAILHRRVVDEIKIYPRVNGKLDYERSIKEDNIYHGNLLLSPHTTKQEMMMIANVLACIVDYIIPQKNP